MTDDTLKRLKHSAKAHGLQVVERGKGHFQITGGALLVNYYPASKRKVAYIAGTTEGVPWCTPEKAVSMALKAPPMAPAERKDKRGAQRARKVRLWRDPARRACYVCREAMTFDEATVEHIIPLARGGLDNDNNCALSHEHCNHERGHNMPELKQSGGA